MLVPVRILQKIATEIWQCLVWWTSCSFGEHFAMHKRLLLLLLLYKEFFTTLEKEYGDDKLHAVHVDDVKWVHLPPLSVSIKIFKISGTWYKLKGNREENLKCEKHWKTWGDCLGSIKGPLGNQSREIQNCAHKWYTQAEFFQQVDGNKLGEFFSKTKWKKLCWS